MTDGQILAESDDDSTYLHGIGNCQFETCEDCQDDAACPTCGEFGPIVTIMNAWRECPDGHGRYM